MPTENADLESSKLRVIFGPVSIVRAIPSREVSVISIEVPEEFHVEVTNLLYGRDALITLSTLVGASYGVIDPASPDLNVAQAATEDVPQASDEKVKAIHGRVIGVRAVSSRGVTIVNVEVPEQAHVQVTMLLYGHDVLVMPVSLGVATPYGVVTGCGSTVHTPNARAGSIQPLSNLSRASFNAAKKTGQGAQFGQAVQPGARSGLIRVPPVLDLVKWVSARCAEEGFQDFLEVRNEAQAIDYVRTTCAIASRRELMTNPAAKGIFMEQIYHPFLASTAGSRL